ncbi:hypothetical protein A9Q99_02155 [Gammaproteobacteria bacterium 45_16_T64]|nr:hypothetical protein A9Q99_02155 [Gammaproteobacteria bacterium 45_16_T64]
MKWLNNLSISKKLWLSTGSFFIFLGVILSTSLWVSSQLANDLDILANKYFVANQGLLKADSHLYRAISAERTLLFVKVGSPRFNNLKTFHQQNIETAIDTLKDVDTLLATTELTDKLQHYSDLMQSWNKISNDIIVLREGNSKESRREAVSLSLNEATKAFASMHDILDENTNILNSTINTLVKEANSHRKNSASLLIGVSLIVLLMGSLLTLLLIKGIAHPISQLTFRLQQIAGGDGDLTQRLKSDRKDEIGEVALAFNAFAEKQANLIIQIKVAMNEFLEKMQQMERYMGSLRDSTQNQQKENNLVADSMEQMSSAINEVADIAVKTTKTTNTTGTLAKQGQTIVTESLDFITNITDSIDATSTVILDLDSKSQNINSVSDSISEIASQTNLLSLNAAIEAARAGQSGRGFAVVADEVRNLAIKTQELTQQINSSIEDLNQGSANAVTVMQQSLEDSQTLRAKAHESGEALAAITNSVEDVISLTSQLALSSEQQAITSDKVASNTGNLNSMATESHRLATNTLSEVVALRSVAEQMNSALSQFKVDTH